MLDAHAAPAAVLALALLASPTAAADSDDSHHTGPFVGLEGHASLLSDVADKSMLASTFGGAVRGGYRWCNWGVFLHVEENAWLGTELQAEVVPGALSIAVGGELIYGADIVRSSIALGPSILLYDSVLDDAGSTGLFLEVRPAGLRWAVHENVVIAFDGLTFALVAPVLGGIPLIQVEYRTVLGVEGVF